MNNNKSIYLFLNLDHFISNNDKTILYELDKIIKTVELEIFATNKKDKINIILETNLNTKIVNDFIGDSINNLYGIILDNESVITYINTKIKNKNKNSILIELSNIETLNIEHLTKKILEQM